MIVNKVDVYLALSVHLLCICPRPIAISEAFCLLSFSCWSVACSTPSMETAAVLCVDITPAIQQKFDNVVLLPKAIEPYPSVHSKQLHCL